MQTVALEAMRRYLLQVDLETLTPSVVKVILSGLAAIQANNQLSRTQRYRRTLCPNNHSGWGHRYTDNAIKLYEVTSIEPN